jgi:hypothetical protein
MPTCRPPADWGFIPAYSASSLVEIEGLIFPFPSRHSFQNSELPFRVENPRPESSPGTATFSFPVYIQPFNSQDELGSGHLAFDNISRDCMTELSTELAVPWPAAYDWLAATSLP